ncbi:hypothetical protein BT67DRAFT_450214 [Trichocladium antarcticum]|uniref:Roadblock/LAMTOR2 domain-containing protein n=1 Tax=Trichocladium antarcticum TaxID=1450529 RepID=A0AAN6UI80_9PEZI|nr:hypothetical protein BT67DRAFT_450214 [Trichocladium antarcticum]
MSDPVTGTGSDALDETLGRLSKKAGVRATLVLDRVSGAVLKTNGQIDSIRKTKLPGASLSAAGPFSNEGDSNSSSNQNQGAEELAAMVWNFVRTAGSLVQELDSEDEMKLLRLRTKKQEFVIVPDAKYLLIVVHDTSSA